MSNFFFYLLYLFVYWNFLFTKSPLQKASAGKWKVLILDDATTRIVSSSLTMFDIMENNVSLVENLAKGRQPFPDLDAVYFITPSMKSAKKVMGDFVSRTRAAEMPPVDGKPVVPVQRYADVHLIFNGSVSFPSISFSLSEFYHLLIRFIF